MFPFGKQLCEFCLFLLTTILYGWFIAFFFTTEAGAKEVIVFTSYLVLFTGVIVAINKK